MTWCVAEISFRPTNPIHRYVIHTRHETLIVIYGTETPIYKNPSELEYFEIVDKIPSMNANKYTNKFKLPYEVKTT